MKEPRVCYMCGAVATSREHVPPLCLFPEKKDYADYDFRVKLITVPSCDEHNGKKSLEDEFLLAALAGIVGNNPVGLYQNTTKVKRGLDKSRKKFNELVLTNSEEIEVKLQNGEMGSGFAGKPDMDRMKKCFEHIAYGLYFYEKKKIFIGECSVFIGFVTYLDDGFEQTKKIIQLGFELESKNTPVKGANPHVFTYKFLEADKEGMISLKMVFYGNADVYVVFKTLAAVNHQR